MNRKGREIKEKSSEKNEKIGKIWNNEGDRGEKIRLP